ncbi:hypothetical protein FPQ18DRAFT_54680 [Pyronema domesticum]|nr:hypothetical protein FPQ18DRAFT_54680 [Pyronema domesticum]
MVCPPSARRVRRTSTAQHPTNSTANTSIVVGSDIAFETYVAAAATFSNLASANCLRATWRRCCPTSRHLHRPLRHALGDSQLPFSFPLLQWLAWSFVCHPPCLDFRHPVPLPVSCARHWDQASLDRWLLHGSSVAGCLTGGVKNSTSAATRSCLSLFSE